MIVSCGKGDVLRAVTGDGRVPLDSASKNPLDAPRWSHIGVMAGTQCVLALLPSKAQSDSG